jgi:hypothetical protein
LGKKAALNERVDELKSRLLLTVCFLQEFLTTGTLRMDNIERKKHRLKASQGTGSPAPVLRVAGVDT